MANKAERNKFRNVVMKAEDKKIITKEEAGFIVMLVDRFRRDIEQKVKQFHVLQGEISQLRVNEKIIVDLVENMVAAAERDIARRATMDRIRGKDSEETEHAIDDEED